MSKEPASPSWRQSFYRRRSRTLGVSDDPDVSLGVAQIPPLSPAPSSRNVSRFEDSDDEEHLHHSFLHSSLAHKSRLAALGTASRFFKTKRNSGIATTSGPGPLHSSATSTNSGSSVSTSSPSPRGSPAMLRRPMTSEGTSGLAGRFGYVSHSSHRATPSEVQTISSHTSRSKSPESFDLGLQLSLQGGPIRPKKEKVAESAATALRIERIDEPRLSHDSFPWPLPPHRLPPPPPPPPYRESSGDRPEIPPLLYRPPPPISPEFSNPVLRKTRSSSTLRYDPQRRPRQLTETCATEKAAKCEPASECTSLRQDHGRDSSEIPQVAERPSPPHVRPANIVEVREGEGTLEPRPLLPRHAPKQSQLPPQKPPPRFLPPPPPPACPKKDCDVTNQSGSPGDARKALNAPASRQARLPVDPLPAIPPSEAATLPFRTFETTVKTIKLTEPAKPQHGEDMQQLIANTLVDLNVGGTHFTTLLTTLRGAPGDTSRPFNFLVRQLNDKLSSASKLAALPDATSRETETTKPRRSNTRARRRKRTLRPRSGAKSKATVILNGQTVELETCNDSDGFVTIDEPPGLVMHTASSISSSIGSCHSSSQRLSSSSIGTPQSSDFYHFELQEPLVSPGFNINAGPLLSPISATALATSPLQVAASGLRRSSQWSIGPIEGSPDPVDLTVPSPSSESIYGGLLSPLLDQHFLEFRKSIKSLERSYHDLFPSDVDEEEQDDAVDEIEGCTRKLDLGRHLRKPSLPSRPGSAIKPILTGRRNRAASNARSVALRSSMRLPPPPPPKRSSTLSSLPYRAADEIDFALSRRDGAEKLGGARSHQRSTAFASECVSSDNSTTHPNTSAVSQVEVEIDTTRMSTSITLSIFIDRSPSLYSTLLATLRSGRIPHSLVAPAESEFGSDLDLDRGSSKSEHCNHARCLSRQARIRQRARLYSFREEADWLGYHSIVSLCDAELAKL
ncbi:hypothetical protein BCV70DRAFT_218162 [Testicularia cyperi]|uniref:Uncharacterized protein n=1 Tax=Testicularia cyperi TaxID=1882483 RepID=A0A317XMW2_9BASI|nr:hypothetical protein BCV70DRAFT_218162 [Testicularia cyperi]